MAQSGLVPTSSSCRLDTVCCFYIIFTLVDSLLRQVSTDAALAKMGSAPCALARLHKEKLAYVASQQTIFKAVPLRPPVGDKLERQTH